MPDESIQIPIEIKPVKGFDDLAKVSTVVSKAVQVMEANVQHANASFQALGSKLNIKSIPPLDITADTSAAIAKINQLVALADKTIAPLDVTADTSAAIAKINQLIALTGLAIPPLDVTADTSAAIAKINQLVALADIAIAPLDVTADTSAAIAKINQLVALADIAIAPLDVTADTSAAIAKINQLVALADVGIAPLDITADTSAALVKINELLAVANKRIPPLDIPTSTAIRSIEQLEAEIGQLENAIHRATNFSDIKRFNDQITALNRQISNMKVVGFETNLNRVTDASGRAASALSKIPGGANPAIFSLTNMGRVLQDLPYGMIGVANNITPLIESMVSLSANAKATGVSMGKQLLASITGGGGLIFGFSILTSVMQFATLGLSAFTRGAGGAGKKTAEIKNEVFDFGKTLDEVAGELSKSASKVTQLFAALNSGKLNFDERKAALKELASVNKEFFGSLKEEDGLIKGLQSAYDGYILRLKEIGKTKAIESQLTKLFDKKLQLELAIDPKFISAIDPNLQAGIQKLRNELESLGGPVDLTKIDFTKTIPGIDATTKKVNEFGKAVEQLPPWDENAQKQAKAVETGNNNLSRRIYLMQRIGQLENDGGVRFVPGVLEGANKDINTINLQIEALSKLLSQSGNFEIPVPDGKDASKVMDETIARARLFVKEFGDIFEVPDLEESFFKTKLQVFQEAADLLKNIEIKNLKIKIPKIDIEATEGLVPFTPQVDPNFKFDDDGKIRQAMIENLKKEFSEPIDDISADVNIQLISKNQTDQIDKLVAGFVELGDVGVKALSKIDFTNVNDGIAEGTKKLEGLKLELSLLKELAADVGDAFGDAFGAIIRNENPLKAFFDGIIQSINRVIQRLVAAAAQAATLSLISGGGKGKGWLDFFVKIAGGGGGIANFGNRVAFAGAGAGIANINVNGILRGPDIYLSGNAGGRAIGRAGG